MRTFKEERFFEQVLGVVNRFADLIKKYQETPSLDNKRAVSDELAIDKEMLGFKYWIIKKDEMLSQVFANDIIWNKTA